MNIIIILHGWGSCSENWFEVKKFLEGEGYRVLVPDLPGFGNTLPPKQEWFVDNYVEWLRNFCEKQNVSQFFLFGHSFGGRIAIKFAAKYYEKLKGLILCSSAGIKPKRNLVVLLIAKIGKIIFRLPVIRKFYPLCQKIFYVKILRKTDYLKAMGIMKEILKNIVDEDLTPYLSQIKVPTLILWGKKDKMTPVKDAYLMHQEIKNSKLEVFKGIGHSIRRENPILLVEEIKKFLK